MNFLQSFRMSLKALGSKKGRSFLTMLGIIIGVAAVIAQVSVQGARNRASMEYYLKSGQNRVNVYINSWRNSSLPDALYDFCTKELADISLGVTPNVQKSWDMKVKYGSKTLEQPRVFFASDKYTACTNNTIERGRDLAYMDLERNNRVALIGAYVKDKLFNYRNPVGEYLFINGEKFLIVGVMEAKYADMADGGDAQWTEDNSVVLPYTQMRLLYKDGRLDQFVVKAKDATTTKEVEEKLIDFLKPLVREEWDYNVYSENTWMEGVEEQQAKDSMTLASIAAISLLVGGIGVMNIMLVTVTERTREIGIRKAIGAPRRSIIIQFWIEASVLTFMGGLLGLVAGFLYTLFWAKIAENMIVFPEVGISVLALGVTVALGIGFGIYPAIKASALQPVVALRNE